LKKELIVAKKFFYFLAEEPLKGPGDRSLKIENKNFFWSCKKNSQGQYISISEVKGGYR